MEYTDDEKTYFNLWLLNKNADEISSEMGISKSYLSVMKEKFDAIHNEIGNDMGKRLAMLEGIGLIEPLKPIKLTEKGRESLKKYNDHGHFW